MITTNGRRACRAPRRSRSASASRASPPDFDETTNSVRSRSSESASRRIAFGCVVSRTWNAVALERPPQHLGRELRAAHPEQDDVVDVVGDLGANSAARRRRSRIRSGSSSQPSQCASSCPVQTVGSRSQIRSTSSARLRSQAETSSPRFARIPSSSSSNESENFCTPSSSSTRVTSSIETPAASSSSKSRARLVEPSLDRQRDLAVILERLDRLLRHRVHGVAGRSAPRRRCTSR